MKKRIGLIGSIITGLSLMSSAQVIWSENFENAVPGATSGNNQTMAGTAVQTANTASGVIVDLDDPGNATIKSAFTHGSGNVILISVGDNDYAALRSSLDPITFSAVSDSDAVTLSFDMYIPTALQGPVGLIGPRLEAFGATGNGPVIDDQEESAAGSYRVVYTASVGDWLNGAGPADSARPFIYVEQKQNSGDNGTTANVVYIDNIHFEIGVSSGLPTDGRWTFSQLKSAKRASSSLVKWQHFGPGMSGYIDKFWINNGDPNAMYDELDMGNGQVTLNRGEYWHTYKDTDGNGLPGGITGIEFSYQDPDFGLMMAKEGIYQSTDRGVTWDFVLDIDTSNSQMHSVLTVDPANDDIWYIGAGQHWMIKSTHWTSNGLHYSSDGNYSAGFILKSIDRGQSWTKYTSVFPSDTDFSKIIVDPRDSDMVYASCQYGVYKSTNGGVSWALVPGYNQLPNNRPRDMGFYFNGTNEFLLYVLEVTDYEPNGNTVDTYGGVYRSADGGANWENLTGDLGINMDEISLWDYQDRYWRAVSWYLEMDKDDFKIQFNQMPTNTFSQFTRIAVDPTNKGRIYLSHNTKHDYAFPPGNIWMTENGGTNWFAAAREGPYWANGVDTGYWNSRTVQPLGANVTFAHVHNEHYSEDQERTGPRFVFCNQLGEVYTAFAQQIIRSTDHGATWNQIDDDETAPGNGHWVGRGNSNLPGETFCLHTGTPGTYLWGSGEHGLWRNTDDGGKVYPGAIAVEQLTGQSHMVYDTLSMSSIAVHPHDNNKIYTLQFRQGNRGALRYSPNNGASWQTLSTPIVFPGSGDVLDQHSLLIDYNDPDNIYFCVPWSEWERWSSDFVNNGRKWSGDPDNFGQGIYKSADGGYTWSMITNGIPADRSVYRMAMDPVDPQMIYAALNETHERDPGGLFKTTDGGTNWTQVVLPGNVVSVNNVQVHETTRDIYIACGAYSDSGENGGGYVSRDGGATWELLFDLPYLRHFNCSLANTNVIVANADKAQSIGQINPGAYVSIDGGTNWFKINSRHGQPDGLRKIEPDPYDETVLWMSLHGTGFFRADLSPLFTGQPNEPFFWDWMEDEGQMSMFVDTDGDGFDARAEFIAGTDPDDHTSYFSVHDYTVDASTGNHIHFDSVTNRLYTVEFNDDLTSGWSVLTNGIDGTGSALEVVDPAAEPSRFYRVFVEMR